MTTPSTRPGIGATPYPGGVTFRLWAPNAQSVAVAGSFNAWSATATPLASEGSSGQWSADVSSAKVSDRYRFVISGRSTSSLDARSRSIDDATGDSVVYDANAFAWSGRTFAMPGWNELVVYELHVGTFYDLTPNAPGTFGDAAQKLRYLADLGINAIQVMPIHDFGGAYSAGYDVANPFAVDRTYGGADAFKAFVDAAHAQGIAVILDVVYNHWGPDASTLWRYDLWYENGWGGIYFYQDWRAWTPWTETGRPDYGRGEVRQYIRDNALMWLDEFRVDGLRWDSVSYTRNVYGNDGDPAHDLPDAWSLIQWVGSEKNASQPWKILIGEDLKDNAWITKSTGEGGAGCDAQWDLGFADGVRAAIVGAVDDDRDMGRLKRAIENRYNGGAFERVIYTESHDEANRRLKRVPDAISPGDSGSYFARKRSTLGAAIVMTAPGIPMILQGQEFLEWHYFDVTPNDDSEMNWGLSEQYAGIVNLYRDLIRLRRNWFDNTRGLRGEGLNVYFSSDVDKIIAFHRWDQGGPGDDVIVVVNLRNAGYASYTIGFPRPGNWYVRYNSDFSGYGADFGNAPGYDTTASSGECQGMPCKGNVGIGPYSVIILSQ
jgi:1,4-alpha-glucan branching enzyme